jgi:hypothetical protein
MNADAVLYWRCLILAGHVCVAVSAAITQEAMAPILDTLKRTVTTFFENNLRFAMPCSVLNTAFVATRDAVCCDILYVHPRSPPWSRR